MKRFLPFALAALLAVLPPAVSAQTASDLQIQFKEAYALQKKGNYSKALQSWDGLLAEYPNEVAAYVNRALTRYYLKDLRGAVDDLSAAIARKENYADAYYNRGAILYQLKDYQGALSDYETYLKVAPSGADLVPVKRVVGNLRRRVGPTTVAATATPATQRPEATATAPTDSAAAAQTSTPARPAPAENVAAASTKPAPSESAAAAPAKPARPSTDPAAAASPAKPAAPAASNQKEAGSPSVLAAASTPTTLPPGVYSLGRIAGYDATTEDLLLGVKVSVQRGLFPANSKVAQYAQNFVVQMKRGANVEEATKRSGLGKQSLIRLAWRGAAWRTYKVFIR